MYKRFIKNIPIDVALQILAQLLPNNALKPFLIGALRFVMKNNYFTFQNKIYLQQNGSAMGSSVSPACV